VKRWEPNCRRLRKQLDVIQAELKSLQLGLPKPIACNRAGRCRRGGECRTAPLGRPPTIPFEPKDHVAIGERFGMDFEAAGRISGARFVVMTGNLAKLHRALIQFMLDMHTAKHGYREAYVPYLVHAIALEGTGQLAQIRGRIYSQCAAIRDFF